MSTLTKRQKEILDYIKVSSQINGYAPSLSEIKNHFQLSATSTVHEHIQSLKKKGYITQELNQARSIRLIDNVNSPEKMQIEVPVVGKLTSTMTLANSHLTYIPVSTSIISQNGEYYGYEIDYNLNSLQLQRKDLLIFSANTQVQSGSSIFLLSQNEFYYLGTKIENDYKIYLSDHSTRNVTEAKKLGNLITLIRQYE